MVRSLRVKNRALFAAGLLSVLAVLPARAAEQLRYRQTRGTEASIYVWKAETAGALVHVTVDEDQGSSVHGCEPTGATLTWTVKETGIDAHAQREQNHIVLSGRRDGAPFSKRIEIDADPWYQALSYSLRQFARSGAASVRFWTLRPDSLAATKLKAERAGRERIDTLQGAALADKVRISTTGLLSGLWEAHYWFDAETGVFLRYEGVNGFPGTPKTVIQLIGTDSSDR